MLMGKHKNRKWEKRPQLYKGRLFYLRRTLQFAGLGFCVLLFLSTWLYFKKSPTLNIRNVSVSGQFTHFSAEDIIKISGVREEDKLFDVNLDQVSANIRRHPWVDAVRLRREFPDNLQVHVQERQARAVLFIGEFYLVDANGVVFKKLEQDDFQDLPILSGFAIDFVKKYPALSKKYLDEVLSFLLESNDVEFYKKFGISEIKFDAVFGFTVYTKEGQFEIYYGRGDIQKKHEKLVDFSATKSFVPEKILRLDLNARDKVVARIL